MEEDIIKVVRLYEFTGPRSVIEKQISRSVHGEQTHGKVTVNAYTLGTWPEIVQRAVADNKQRGPEEYVPASEPELVPMPDLE